MEKQHNRGQDGAGIATVKLNSDPGHLFMHRLRIGGSQAISQIFGSIHDEAAELERTYPHITRHPAMLKGHLRFMGEVMLATCAMAPRPQQLRFLPSVYKKRYAAKPKPRHGRQL